MKNELFLFYPPIRCTLVYTVVYRVSQEVANKTLRALWGDQI